MELKHYSVLLNESIEMLNVKEDGIYVDCTLGGGGHSLKILEKLTTGHLYSFDVDSFAITKSLERLKDHLDKLTIINSNFENIKEELRKLGVDKVDGIIYDLGVSSFQFDDESRGFSYRFDSKLDMRMNQDDEFSAYDVVNTYSYSELVKIFFEYGEEKFSRNIADKIVKMREAKPIETTFELVDIIKSALPNKVLRMSGHPAKQVFQAIRIEVNHELSSLKKSLNSALSILNKEGRCVVISFHSLEDRIVKNVFKEHTTLDLPKDLPFIPDNMQIEYELINKKIITPSSDELDENNRSHSAKMRGIKKLT